MSCPNAAVQPVRVLVVDDQQVYRDTAQFVIEMSEGFEVAGVAHSGEDGVELARRLEPDLILMDINMPGIDGLEATRLITTEMPHCRVLVYSTHSAMEYERLAIEAGAAGFLSKSLLDPSSLTESWRSTAPRFG